MRRVYLILIALVLMNMIGSGDQQEKIPFNPQAQATGYLKSMLGDTVIEITYQRMFPRDDGDREKLDRNLQELLVGLKGDYYGTPDGWLLSGTEIPLNGEIECSVAVTFTGFSYCCFKNNTELRGDSFTAEGAVDDMRQFLREIRI